MHDETVGLTSLEPQSRPSYHVLLVLASAPAPPRAAVESAVSDAMLPSASNGVHPDPVRDSPVDTLNGGTEISQHAMYRLLTDGGNMVTWTTRSDWSLDFGPGRNDTVFDVIVVECDSSSKAVGKLKDAAGSVLAQLRASPVGKLASILALVPTARRGEKAGKQIMALLEAGADDIISPQATPIEVESRLRAMTLLSRARCALEAARDQLRLQLQTDDLTKLLNRRFFFQNAHREVGRARRYNSDLSCLMVEIDHYKKLCSIIGYESGDIMLRALAQVLRDLTRDSDIVARFGDEKFVAVLPETTIEGATMLREKIQAAMLQETLEWQGHNIPISVSVGEANRLNDVVMLSDLEPRSAPDDDSGEAQEGAPLSTREELAELLRAADSALFVAKRGVRLPNVLAEGPSCRIPTGLDVNDKLPTRQDD